MSLKDRAYDAMKAAIVRMDIYAPNAELRFDERGLSARFGVSRTPLRQALALLDNERLIKIVARRGIFIVRKTKAEILEMITVWAALESMAARIVTKIATDAEIEALDRLLELELSGETAEDASLSTDADIRFHQAIIKASGRPLIGDITEGFAFHMRAIHHRIIDDPDRARRCADDHVRIVAALKMRDGERAERLVREHMLMLREHIARHVDLN